MKLNNKVVVVTGSGGGVGEGFARRAVAEGAKVVVTDINADGVERVATSIGAEGLVADIATAAGVKAVADLARRAYGEVDVWFSNAGVSGPRQPGDIQDLEWWDLGWNLHVMSHVHAVREVLPAMLRRGDGYLLQTASSVALSTQPEKASYSVTKHAALALAEWLVVNFRSKGIKVSCFCPGPMLTPMLLANDFPADHPVLKMALTPEQVADILVDGIAAEQFLIVDSPGTVEVLAMKARDYEQWITDLAALAL